MCIETKGIFKKIAVVAAAGLIVGCAGAPKPEPPQMALGKWQNRAINADGSKDDWPRSAPQYENSETDTKMWISNNAEQVCLLAQVKDPGMARQLIQNGLILSVETGEKGAKPFSIKLKGHTPFRSHGGPGHGEDNKDAKTHNTPDTPPDPIPVVKLPDAVIVTYPFSSGPVTMSMKEARDTGIDLGLADPGRHILIFEALIRLDAIFYDVPRPEGTKIKLSLSAKENSFAMERQKNPDDKKGDRPKGGPPGGGPSKGGSPDQGPSGTGKSNDMKQTKGSDQKFRAAVEITLAGPSQ